MTAPRPVLGAAASFACGFLTVAFVLGGIAAVRRWKR